MHAGFYGREPRNVPELELVIVGAGAAGLSAAIYAALMEINFVVVDAEQGGGLMTLAKTIENMPGVSGKRGPELTQTLIEQLERNGARVRTFEPAQELRFARGDLAVQTSRNAYRPKCVIIATGLELLGLREEYGVEGEREWLGKGVSYCAECDAPLFRGKSVLVAGNPFDAFVLARVAAQVTYLGPVPEEFRSQVPREILEANDIDYIEGDLQRLEGGTVLEAAVIDGVRRPCDGVFISRRKAGTEIYADAGLKLSRDGFIETNRAMETNIEGVFAAGDITGEPWQISKSVGEGAVACLSAFRFLTGRRMRNLGWALQDEWEQAGI